MKSRQRNKFPWNDTKCKNESSIRKKNQQKNGLNRQVSNMAGLETGETNTKQERKREIK